MNGAVHPSWQGEIWLAEDHCLVTGRLGRTDSHQHYAHQQGQQPKQIGVHRHCQGSANEPKEKYRAEEVAHGQLQNDRSPQCPRTGRHRA